MRFEETVRSVKELRRNWRGGQNLHVRFASFFLVGVVEIAQYNNTYTNAICFDSVFFSLATRNNGHRPHQSEVCRGFPRTPDSPSFYTGPQDKSKRNYSDSFALKTIDFSDRLLRCACCNIDGVQMVINTRKRCVQQRKGARGSRSFPVYYYYPSINSY